MRRARLSVPLGVALLLAPGPHGAAAGGVATSESDSLPVYLRDRGEGVPTSLFGTYVRAGELLVYPFYEYTTNKDQEYKPSELGYPGEHDYRAKGTEHEALLFASYGISPGVIVELESALYTWATQEKAPGDTSAVPSTVREQGFGDTQAEIRWRWWKETERRPEFWSYFEVVFPFQRDRVLIGTQDWELIQGFGLIRGFGFGTMTARVSASYTAEDQSVIFGEYALEYLKRLSPKWRVVLAVEGEQDEVAGIGEVQYWIVPRAVLKMNNGFGLSSKAPDLAPEVGIAISL